MQPLESVADRSASSAWFQVNADGKPVTRERVCECGRTFTQRQLSERFMLMAERKSKGAAAAVLRSVPQLFVPVHCPPCERYDLARQAQLDDAKHFSPNYMERPDAA